MRSRHKTTETKPLDPIAMTLAIWLGLIVGVTGLIRLSENAAEQTALARSFPGPAAATSTDDVQLFNPRLIAYGG